MSRNDKNSTKPYYSTRTFLELSVGISHTIEVYIYLRRKDLSWWNDDVASHQKQLFAIIGRQILPKECSDDISQWHDRRNENQVVIGEKNLPQQQSTTGATAQSKKNTRGVGKGKRGKKRGRSNDSGGAAAIKNKKNDASSSTTAAAAAASSKKKGESEIITLFGDTIQITYKTEDADVRETATLLYSDNTSSSGKDRKELATFRQLQKLSKRIVLWCYRFDPENPTLPNPIEDGGFPRPELIPISSLFRRVDGGVNED